MVDTITKLLSIEELEKMLSAPIIPGGVIPMNRNHARQLLDTMRENERLCKGVAKCKRCGILK